MGINVIMDERYMNDEERQANVDPDVQNVDDKCLGEECNIVNDYDVLQEQLRSVGLKLYLAIIDGLFYICLQGSANNKR